MALNSSDLVQRVRDILQDRAIRDTSTTTGTGSPVTVADTSIYSVGHVVEWQTGTVGYEQMYVTAIPNATTLTVIRGYNGTTAESHTSGDALIIEPTFPGRTIQQAITHSVNAAWPVVWKPGDVSLTYAQGTKWYDLETTTRGIISVTQKKNLTVTDYGRFRDKYQGDGLSYIVQVDLPSTVVASLKGISFPGGVYDSRTSGGNPIIVRTIEQITGTNDIEDSADLPVAEALTWMACGRLLRAKEVQRVLAGEPGTTVASVGTGVRYSLGKEYQQEGLRQLEMIKYRLYDLYDPDDLWGH